MPDLFQMPTKELVLHGYQAGALDSARENIRKGNRRQILCAPTGAGKTIIALGLMQAAQRVGSRSAFVTDRSALIDQTSNSMDEYGIDHGVMQAARWRCRPNSLVQLLSAQTLGRRLGRGGYVDHHLRDLRFVLIDECHTLYQSTTEWLAMLPEHQAAQHERRIGPEIRLREPPNPQRSRHGLSILPRLHDAPQEGRRGRRTSLGGRPVQRGIRPLAAALL